MNKVFIGCIKFYKAFISPLMASRCRFYPTCSAYALEAFEEYGFFKAFSFSIRRLFRCHPFCKGGVDPLPTTQNKNG